MHISLYKIFHYIDTFDKDYIDKIDKNIILIYRNYKREININYLKELRDYCKLRKKKIILSNNLKISKQLKFDGVYLPSFNKKIVRSDNVKKDFFIIGSAHNLKEIREKEKQGVNQIFISPLFKTKNKKNLGIYRFNQLNSLTNKKVIALGGINNNNLNKLKLIKVDAFASISYIQNKYDK